MTKKRQFIAPRMLRTSFSNAVCNAVVSLLRSSKACSCNFNRRSFSKSGLHTCSGCTSSPPPPHQSLRWPFAAVGLNHNLHFGLERVGDPITGKHNAAILMQLHAQHVPQPTGSSMSTQTIRPCMRSPTCDPRYEE